MKIYYYEEPQEGILIKRSYEIRRTRNTITEKVWSEFFKLHKSCKGTCPEIAGEAEGEGEEIYVDCVVKVTVFYDKVNAKTVKSIVDDTLSEDNAMKYINALWRMASKKILGYIADFFCVFSGVLCSQFVAGHSEDMSFDSQTETLTLTDIYYACYPLITQFDFVEELDPAIHRALVALRKGVFKNVLRDNRVNFIDNCLFIRHGVEDIQECIDSLTNNEIVAPGSGIFVKDIFLYGQSFHNLLPLTNVANLEEGLGLPGFFLNDVPSLTIEKLFRQACAPWFSQALYELEPYSSLSIYSSFVKELLSTAFLARILYDYGQIDGEYSYYSILPRASVRLAFSDLMDMEVIQPIVVQPQAVQPIDDDDDEDDEDDDDEDDDDEEYEEYHEYNSEYDADDDQNAYENVNDDGNSEEGDANEDGGQQWGQENEVVNENDVDDNEGHEAVYAAQASQG